MRFFLFGFISLWMVSLFGQPNNRKIGEETRPFFEAQIPFYEAWLEDQGFSQVLAIEQLEVMEDSLTLFLYLTAEDQDSAIQSWMSFSKQYAQNYGSDPARDLLVYLAFLMEQARSKIGIELYDVKEGQGTPVFYLGIYEKEGGVIENKPTGTMSQDVEIDIPPFTLKNSAGLTETDLNEKDFRKASRKRIMDEVQQYVQTYFEKREAEVIPDRKGNKQLSMEIRNLEREVLKDLPPSILEDLFGLAKKERLLLEFRLLNEDEGYTLELKVHGMYGTGIMEIFDSGYRPMEPDFTSYLHTFAKKFKNSLSAYLLDTFVNE
ncbi:MAG: hypothetical protein AAFS00_06485 [Bacteroidota bacterium]